jgi:hypothetical protein
MRPLLVVGAALEASIGLALLAWPSLPVSLLLGSTLDAPVGETVARVGGAALLSLGAACWLARNEPRGVGARALIGALLIYNLAVTGLLIYAAAGLDLAGFGLGPVVLLHAVMAIWCVASLRILRS